MESVNLTAGNLYKSNLRFYWLSYTVGILALLLCSVTEVLIPKYVQWSIDLISGKQGEGPAFLRGASPAASLRLLLLAMLASLALGLLGRVGWRQMLARRTHVAGRDIKVRLWRVLRLLPLRTFQDYSLGDLMNRAIGDWNAARAIHGFTLVASVDMIFFTVLSVICMLTIDARLTLYCLLVFPLLPPFILRLARREHALHVEAQEQLGTLSEIVAQALGTIRLQRATNSEDVWQQRLNKQAAAYAVKRFAVVKTGWKIFPLGALPTLIAYGILLVLGVRRIAAGELTIGQFVAMQSYVLMLQGPLFDMGDNIAEWQRGMASFGRIVAIFKLQGLADTLGRKQQLPAPPAVATPTAGVTVVAKALRFSYAGSTRPVLDGIDMQVDPGGIVGISGAIGTGKTTLLTLLAGLSEVDTGMLWLDGVDVHDLARSWLARECILVPQRAFLFAGTIRYNLELDEAFADPALWAVLELVQIAADVRGFPDGLDTWVGEWGINLSGGQKQRLALARALLRQRRLILLDDCLSAVDAVTEEAILHGLRAHFAAATVIWVAHRRSTLKLCDRTYQLAQGKLIAQFPARSATGASDPLAKGERRE